MGLDAAAKALARARRVVVFTGAGVSSESGIRTFREKDTGLWSQYDPMEMATLEGYLKDPPLVWSWYEHRFGTIRTAEPNPGHRAIAELEELLPEVIVVTQNIDGLHQRAGSSDVIELHGTMHRFSCLHRRHTGFTQDDIEKQDARPPRCPECGELLRPDVVWFGEALPHEAYERALHLSAACDAMLVVGTSAVVYPAAALPQQALYGSAIVIDVNPEPSALSRVATVYLRGKGGEILPQLVAKVRQIRE